MSTAAAKSRASRWDQLNPRAKQWIVIGGSIAVMFLVIVPFMGSGPQIKVGGSEPKAVGDLLPTGTSRELGLAGLAKDVDSLRKDVQTKDAQIATLREQLIAAAEQGAPVTVEGGMSPEEAARAEEMMLRLAELEARLSAGQGGSSSNSRPAPAGAKGGSADQRVSPPGAPAQRTGGQGPDQSAPELRVPTLRTISAVDEPEEETSAEASDERIAYLPSGSIITGVTLTGLDAPTGRGSRQDPVPVLVRVQHDAILPNRFRADIKECFVLLAGMGDLSSERAYLRGESFSCVREDGGVIDIALNVYAVGEDGKAGLRGTLVSKQGQAIGKAMLAGVAQGASQAFSRGGNGYTSGGGVDLGAAAEGGVYGGAGSALDRVAQFYIDLAEQLFPVIEISAGRQVSLVLVKGSEIRMVRG